MWMPAGMVVAAALSLQGENVPADLDPAVQAMVERLAVDFKPLIEARRRREAEERRRSEREGMKWWSVPLLIVAMLVWRNSSRPAQAARPLDAIYEQHRIDCWSGERIVRRPRRPRELAVDLRAGQCPVCHAGLDGSVVLCERCSTPHHAECFNYAGRCSIFACGGVETAYVAR